MRMKKKLTNIVMMVSLIIVFITGMLIHPVPESWVKILHAVAGLMLTVSVVVHICQNRMRR